MFNTKDKNYNGWYSAPVAESTQFCDKRTSPETTIQLLLPYAKSPPFILKSGPFNFKERRLEIKREKQKKREERKKRDKIRKDGEGGGS